MEKEKNQGNPYIPKKYKIIKKKRMTHDTMLLRIAGKFKQNPGQFVEVGVLGAGECPIGICSYSDKHIDLCIRKVGNVTKAIHEKKVGEALWIRGPYGNGYPMKEIEGKDIVIVGGGTGAAPLVGVLEYIEKNRDKYGKVHAFFGFRSYENILFKDYFSRFKKNFDFEFTLDCPTKMMKCNVGVVTTLIDKAQINQNAVALICGPPIMMKFAVQSLQNKGIREKNIYISFERLMSCGIGKCGHCELGGKYICKHGPVFSYEEAKNMQD
ncbi:MAG: FAD/NAD(P)-binding protein [Candidatus Woesearchaeota archaeon]|nr:FAD/NAD(P)-binding protein [Candidatus Woesearchaeota archaeon]